MTQPVASGASGTAAPAASGGLTGWLGDATVLSGRGVRHLIRNPEQLFVVAFLPTMLLLCFRYLFGGAIDAPGGGYANYIIAGIMAISAAFNATTTTTAVCTDRLDGVLERFRSMPMASTAVLFGHVVAGVVRNLISGVVIVGVGLIVGFRPAADPLRWLAAAGILALFAAGISWLAVLFGLLADSLEGATGLSLIIVFLPYASSALVPPSTLPGFLRAIVDNQPITPVIDALRALMLDLPVGNSGWIAVAWWAGISLVAMPVAGAVLRSRGAAR